MISCLICFGSSVCVVLIAAIRLGCTGSLCFDDWYLACFELVFGVWCYLCVFVYCLIDFFWVLLWIAAYFRVDGVFMLLIVNLCFTLLFWNDFLFRLFVVLIRCCVLYMFGLV